MAWLEQQWNRPDRTDYYLMQVAYHCHLAWCAFTGQTPKKFQQFKMDFTPTETPKLTKEQLTKFGKARVFAMTGYKPKDGEV